MTEVYLCHPCKMGVTSLCTGTAWGPEKDSGKVPVVVECGTSVVNNDPNLTSEALDTPLNDDDEDEEQLPPAEYPVCGCCAQEVKYCPCGGFMSPWSKMCNACDWKPGDPLPKHQGDDDDGLANRAGDGQ